MYCKYCGEKIDVDYIFCPYCDKRLEVDVEGYSARLGGREI